MYAHSTSEPARLDWQPLIDHLLTVAGLRNGYAVAGHYTGLPDRQGDSCATLDARIKAFSEATLDPVWKDDIKFDVHGLLPLVRERGSKLREEMRDGQVEAKSPLVRGRGSSGATRNARRSRLHCNSPF
jgi:hypothetical protein